jgi:hypothetical protein
VFNVACSHTPWDATDSPAHASIMKIAKSSRELDHGLI